MILVKFLHILIGVVDLCRISNPIVNYSYESFSGLIISGGDKHTYMILFLYNRDGGSAQWLGRRISDQGVPGTSRAGAHFVVALSKSHLPCLVLVEPRKR